MKKTVLFGGIAALALIPGIMNAQADLSGDYSWTIQPTDVQGNTEEKVTINVTIAPAEVDEDEPGEEGALNYVMYETGETNYFNGTKIPFVYREGSQVCEFSETLCGMIDGKNINFYPFIHLQGSAYIEPQPLYGIPYTEDGFQFKDNMGFGWFAMDAQGDYPEGLYSGFFLGTMTHEVTDPSDEPEVTYPYPEFAELVGNHNFKATLTWEPGYENLATIFTQQNILLYEEGSFMLESDLSINGFVGSGNNAYLSYDRFAGTLTYGNTGIGTYTADGVTHYIGIAPADGKWNGTVGYNFIWQVTEEGEIAIPDFTIVDYTENPVIVLATYTNCQVDGYPDIESGVAGIEAADNAPAVIYNLQGVRMNGDNLRPGIYIINGKKVAIR